MRYLRKTDIDGRADDAGRERGEREDVVVEEEEKALRFGTQIHIALRYLARQTDGSERRQELDRFLPLDVLAGLFRHSVFVHATERKEDDRV